MLKSGAKADLSLMSRAVCLLAPQSLQGLTGTPLVAGSPIRHENAVQGSAVEVQTYQPPWKALSEFALQSDLDQPAFQQLVRPCANRTVGVGWRGLRSHRTSVLGDRFGNEKAFWTRSLAADTNPILMCLSPGPNPPVRVGTWHPSLQGLLR